MSRFLTGIVIVHLVNFLFSLFGALQFKKASLI